MNAALPILQLAGGLALFLYAIGLLSGSLQESATRWFRQLIGSIVQSPIRGLLTGVLLGTLLHSSASTVLFIGFLDAGLLGLRAALAPVLGANIGTTFAMQVVSFRIADYWMLPLIGGLLLTYAPWASTVLRGTGRAGIGFGLLLLGLELMSGATAPYRETVAPWMGIVSAGHVEGMLSGIGIGLLVTVVVQSSGAAIGMALALIEGGILVRLDQIYPLILGAHIGTCTTALIASVRSGADAKRLAWFHLLVNVAGTVAAALLAPLLLPLLTATAGDLRHQAINAHTGVMLLTMLPLLPFGAALEAGLRRLRLGGYDVEPTHLDPLLLPAPEQALAGAILELRRVARTAARNLRRNAGLLLAYHGGAVRDIERDEQATDEIQRAMEDYLTRLTTRTLSRRQSLMLQHLERCMIDIERMADHNTNLCELSIKRHRERIRLPADALEELLRLFTEADAVLKAVIASLDPAQTDFGPAAAAILSARDAYKQRSVNAQSFFLERTGAGDWSALHGMMLGEYVQELDRMVRHSRLIARLEKDPGFAIDPRDLTREVPERPKGADPEEPAERLRRLLPPEEFP